MYMYMTTILTAPAFYFFCDRFFRPLGNADWDGVEVAHYWHKLNEPQV